LINRQSSEGAAAQQSAAPRREGLSTGGGWRIPLIVLTASLLLAGCAAGPGGKPQSPADQVAQRAKARWAALLDGKAETAYQYYSPGYRSAVSLDAFTQRLSVQKVHWKAAKFDHVECETDLCHPVFKVSYSYRMPVRGVGVVESTRAVTEDWVKTDSGWFFVPPDMGRRGLR